MTSTDEEELLKILEAHGQQFMESFSSEGSKKRKIQRDPSPPRKKVQHNPLTDDDDEDEDEEEWLGISGGFDDDSQSGSEDEGMYEADMFDIQLKNVLDFEQDDDGFTGESSNPQTNVTVFADFSSTKTLPSVASKAQMKAFMVSYTAQRRLTDLHAPASPPKCPRSGKIYPTLLQNKKKPRKS